MGTVSSKASAKKSTSKASVKLLEHVNKKENCNKRHPKTCKRFSFERFCKYGVDCAYEHMDSENSKLEETVILHIARMKAEIIKLKYTIQRFTQSDHVAGELEILKQEIEKLKTENNVIVNNIKVLEKEFKSNNVDESDEENSGNAELVCVLLCNYFS